MTNPKHDLRAAAKEFLVREGIYNSDELEHLTDAQLVSEYRLSLDNLDELQAISDPAAKANMYGGTEQDYDPNTLHS